MSKAAELANLIGNINAGGGGVNRNVIINGSMNVAQRDNGGFTGLGGSSIYHLDRWKFDLNNTAGRFSSTQDSSAPSGFANSLKLECTTADTSIAADELLIFQQRIEGQNLQTFAKGTSSAKPFAVSFYAKANASKTYVAELFDNDNSRQVGKTFTVGTDWTRHEISFPADTTGAFDDDNANSMNLNIWLHAGSNFTSGTLGTTWQAEDATDRAAGIGSFFSSTDNTFFITGVQLEVGQNPTEFEHEPFDKTLIKCQRYYQLVGRDFSDTSPTTAFTHGFTSSATAAEGMFRFERRMRAAPTFTASTDGNIDFRTNTGSGAVHLSGNAFTSATTSETSVFYTQQNHAGNFGGAGQPYYLRFNGVQGTGLAASNQLDAEL